MKNRRIRATFAACLFAVTVLCSACSTPWSTWTMDQVFPAAIDATTWLTNVEAITVTRAADGCTVLVEGTDVELLYDGFFGVECTRRSGDVETLYTWTFQMADGSESEPIRIGMERGTVCCATGEYRYRPVTIDFDLSYMEALFAGK